MKKIFFFATAMLATVSMSAETVFDWAGKVGKLELTGTTAFETVRSQSNTEDTYSIAFNNGYSVEESTGIATNYAELTLEGAGFLQGDVVVIDYFYNNSGDKVATVGVYNTKNEELAASANGINGRKENGFSTFQYTLTENMDTIRIARAKTGKTKTCVAKLEVVRGGVVVTKAGNPVFTPGEGNYFDPFKVALSATPADSIFVRLNNGTFAKYNDSILIDQYDVDYVLEAYSVYEGAENSDTVSATYTLKHFVARPVFNARKEYLFDSIPAEDIIIQTPATAELTSYVLDGKTVPAINYKHEFYESRDSFMLISAKGREDVTFRYKNGQNKSTIMKFANDFLQCDGSNFEIWIDSVKSGDTIVFVVTAKGSAPRFDVQYSTASYLNPYMPEDDTDPCFTDGLVMTSSDAKIENNYSGWTDLVYTVADGGHSRVRIKEVVAGFRIAKILVGAYRGEAPVEGIENQTVDAKAEKFFRNGQLIIRKNGVEYNVLGAEIK